MYENKQKWKTKQNKDLPDPSRRAQEGSKEKNKDELEMYEKWIKMNKNEK